MPLIGLAYRNPYQGELGTCGVRLDGRVIEITGCFAATDVSRPVQVIFRCAVVDRDRLLPEGDLLPLHRRSAEAWQIPAAPVMADGRLDTVWILDVPEVLGSDIFNAQ